MQSIILAGLCLFEFPEQVACLDLDVLALCVGLKHLLQMGLVASVGFRLCK